MTRTKLTRFLCALALTAAAQAQTLTLPANLSAPTYAAPGVVSNCQGTAPPANCTNSTLSSGSNVTISSGTQVILGPNFTATANSSSSLTIMIANGPSHLSWSAPQSATGPSENFALSAVSTYWNNNGWIDIIVNNPTQSGWPAAANGCYVQYSQAANTMYLVDDTGTMLLTGVIPGSGAAFNSQCTLDGAASSVTLTGNTLQATFGITFRSINPAFQGTQDGWIQSSDGTGQTVEWDHIGTWDVTGFTPISVSPGPPPQSGASQQITVSAVSPNWANDGAIDILINGALNAANSCYIQYSQADNTLTLIGNDGVTPLSAITPGSGSQQNSQCILNGSTSYASLSGATLTVTFGLTFLPHFDAPPGLQTIYAVASDGAGENTELQPWATIYVGNPDFTLSVTSTQNVTPSVVMAAGSLTYPANPATYSVSVTPLNGFSDTVNLASALPAGFTTTFAPSSLSIAPGTVGNTTLSIWAPPGATGNITAYAAAAGATTGTAHTASGGVLSVQDFTVTLSPSNPNNPSWAPTVANGSTQSFTITATGINGFTGNITLAWSQPAATCSNSSSYSLPAQIAAGSSVTMTLAPLGTQQNTRLCNFLIEASANGDFHNLPGAVYVSPATNFTITLPPNQSTLTAAPTTQASPVIFTPTVTSTATSCVTIQFTVTGLPAGASATAPQLSGLCGSQTEDITVTVQPGTPQGTYPLTVEADGSNGTTLFIYPVLQVGTGSSAFSISVSPPQTISPGGTAQYTITVNGTAGLGDVTLTATGGPRGATVLLNQSTSTTVPVGGPGTMTIATPSSTGLGTYPISITGTLGTVPKYGATSLTVGAPSAASILTPPPGGLIPGGNTAFSWNSGVGASQYILTVTFANGQTQSATTGPTLQSANLTLPTAAQAVSATLTTLTSAGALTQNSTYTIGSAGSGVPVLDPTVTQPVATINNDGIEVQYTYIYTGGDARALDECDPRTEVVSTRIVLLTQTAATIGFTAQPGAPAQAFDFSCDCQDADCSGGTGGAGGVGDATPEIDSISPGDIPAGAAIPTQITISGANFGLSGYLTIGGPCSLTAAPTGSGWTSTVILASVAAPAGSSGTCLVSVTSNGSTGSGFLPQNGSEPTSDDYALDVDPSPAAPGVSITVTSNGQPVTQSTSVDGGSCLQLTPTPTMPPLTAQIVDGNGNAVQQGSATWQVGGVFSQHFNDGTGNSVVIPQTWGPVGPPVSVPANQPFGPTLPFVGGVATLQWTYNGVAGEPFSFCILGTNPSQDAIITAAQALPYWFAQNITIHETNAEQFCDGTSLTAGSPYCKKGSHVGLPIYGPPGGYGAFQLDTPAPSLDAIWNWQSNVSGAQALISAKAAPAYSTWQRTYSSWAQYNVQQQLVNRPVVPPAEQDPGYVVPFKLSPWCSFVTTQNQVTPQQQSGPYWFGDALAMKYYAGNGLSGAKGWYLQWNSTDPANESWVWYKGNGVNKDIVYEFCTCSSTDSCQRNVR